jgi:hypothetical protein
MATDQPRTYVIEQRGDQWCLLTQDKTQVLGCHASEADAQAQERAVVASKTDSNLHSILGAQVFASGTWNGDVYENSDLDAMVTASREAGFGIPIKAGHVDEPGQPALGWVENLRREGSKLHGDLVALPQKVYDAIRDRAFGAVSAEVFWNLKRNGKTFPRALRGLALLGSEIPAVDLAPLRAFLHAFVPPPGEAAKSYTTELAFAATPTGRDAHPDGQIAPDASGNCPEGYEKGDDGQCHMKGSMKGMSDKTETKTMTEAEKAAAKAEADKVAKAKADAEAAAAAAAMATHTQTQDIPTGSIVVNLKQLEELQRKAAKSDRIEELQRQVDQESAKNAELLAQYRKDTIASKMRGVKMPAFRVYIRALYEMAMEIPEVKTYSLVDEKVRLGAMAIVESLVIEMNRQADTLFATYSQHQAAPARNADDEPDDIQEKIKHRVEAYCKANKLDVRKDYKQALNAVLNEDPTLKVQYSQT